MLLLFLLIGCATASPSPDERHELDCKLRSLALKRALSVRPGTSSTVVADALQLGTLCGITTLPDEVSEAAANLERVDRARAILDAAEFVTFVDAVHGDDTAAGTKAAPYRTVLHALLAIRVQRDGSGAAAVIVLRGGMHTVAETIELTSADSNVSIIGAPGEQATLSGGIPLGRLSWKKEGRQGLFSAKLPVGTPIFDTLYQPSGRRAIRARHPNADPEVTDPGISGVCIQAGGPTSDACVACKEGYNCPGWIHAASQGDTPNPAATWGAAAPFDPPATLDQVWSPQRKPGTNGSSEFPQGTNFPIWRMGHGGPLTGSFDPPSSFWGMAHPEAGAQWQRLTSVSYPARSKVPMAGGDAIDPLNPPIVQAFHGGHWGGWTFEVNQTILVNGSLQMKFSKGGFQEARGSNTGAESFVENHYSLLDSPREWYFDRNSSMLYYMANGTETPPANGWVGSHLETVLVVNGTRQAPVRNHKLIGLTVTHTAPVFLKPYMASLSGSDWAIRPTGAVMLIGTENSLVQDTLFDGVGGNGVMIKGYNRNTTVADSEFIWVGESAIAAIGSTSKIDGFTNANQPRGNQILRNLIHEVGIFGKQTAGFVQQMSCQTTIKNNILFNGPRAGINILDGFGGGNNIEANVAFNWVRETGDHGPFNSWDRQPYLTDIRMPGKPSLVPAQSNITFNLFFNSYSSTWPIDHDDGSCYYYDTKNLLIYGGYKNYLGHSKVVKENIYVHPEWRAGTFGGNVGMCVQDVGVTPTSGWGEQWENNTCIFGGAPFDNNFLGFYSDDDHHLLSARDNTYLVPRNGMSEVNLTLGSSKGITLKMAQAKGVDLGSTIGLNPTPDAVVAMGEQLLGMSEAQPTLKPIVI